MIEQSETTPQSSAIDDWLAQPISALWRWDWEKGIYALILLLAIISRFWALGDRVMSHDESLHTEFSHQFYIGDGFAHTPLMHGPFLFHATAVSYWLFGPSDFSARLPVAILGVLLTIAPYFLRDWIGRKGALVASFLFLISPFVLYYSRYIRHDVYVICWALIVFVATWRYLAERKEKYLWWFAAGNALMFTTKEVSFIYVAIFGSFLLIRLFVLASGANWFDAAKRKVPWLLLLGGIVLLVAGAGGAKWSDQSSASQEIPAETTQFAADPNAPQEEAAADENGTSPILIALQFAGIALAVGALFLTAARLREHLDNYPEFDLIVLYTILILPSVSPLLTTIAGWNPLDYSFSWENFFASGATRSGLFLFICLAFSVGLGVWWHQRKAFTALAIFYAIFSLFFTSVFTNPNGMMTGLVGSLGYWLEQQAVERGNQPWFYYIFIVPFYEFLPMSFAFLAIRHWARQHRLGKIIGYWLGTLLLAALLGSLAYWRTNLNVTGESPPNYLFAGLAAGIILLLAILGWFILVAPRIRQIEGAKRLSDLASRDIVTGFVPQLIWWFFLTYVLYSVAGEKMPWLSIHFDIPMAFLAGWYLNQKLGAFEPRLWLNSRNLIYAGILMALLAAIGLVVSPLITGGVSFNLTAENLQRLGQFLGRVLIAGILLYILSEYRSRIDNRFRRPILALSIFALLSLITIRFTYMANYINADYTNEFLVYAHSAPAVKTTVLPQLEELSMRMHGDKSIRVSFDNDSSWPFTWYLRDYPNRVYFGENPGDDIVESPVAVVGSLNWGKTDPYLEDDYIATTHTFLWWPTEEYRHIGWDNIIPNPLTPPENRHLIWDAGIREALWDIFWYRNYTKYGEEHGANYSAGQWPLRHDLKLYIRKDVYSTIWDFGVGAAPYQPPPDPYAGNELQPQPIQLIGEGILNRPRDVAIAPDGRIYVADAGNHRISVFNALGEYLTSFGDFVSDTPEFTAPWGIAVDDEYVYASNTWNHRIDKFTLEGELVAQFGGFGSPNDDQGAEGFFFGPRDITLLPFNQLAVADTGNHRIQILTRDGEFVKMVGSQGPLLGQMSEPVGLASTDNNLLFLADTWNMRIQRFSADLAPIDEWDVETNWREEQTLENKPFVGLDSAGRVYVTDPQAYRVLVFDQNGLYRAKFGQFGAEPDRFGIVNGIAIDLGDFIYLADSGNGRIAKFAPLFLPAGE